MEALALKTERQISETDIRNIGERSLWYSGVFKYELGINDPLTHLEQYLEHGETAMKSIDEDLITDCAERMEKAVFENEVRFDWAGNDFISKENRFSMRRMTDITERKFAGHHDVAGLKLYKRAKIEATEVDRLSQWFDAAKADDAFIVESLALTNSEDYNVIRIYQKTADTELAEHVVTLHNSSVDTFNRLHGLIGADVAESADELELLENMYAFRPPAGRPFKNFIKDYVFAHDAVLAADSPGKEFDHGLLRSETRQRDDIAAVRCQTALRSVYLDSIRALGRSGGYVTPDILVINHNLSLDTGLTQGQVISADMARRLLDAGLQSVTATLNRASPAELKALASGGMTVADSAGSYGAAARAEGVRYEGACPADPGSARAAEAAAVARGHRLNKDPSRCGTCPKCRKEYYVPEEIYKKRILQCDKCQAAIHFDGSPVRPEEIKKRFKPESKSFIDVLFEILTGG